MINYVVSWKFPTINFLFIVFSLSAIAEEHSPGLKDNPNKVTEKEAPLTSQEECKNVTEKVYQSVDRLKNEIKTLVNHSSNAKQKILAVDMYFTKLLERPVSVQKAQVVKNEKNLEAYTNFADWKGTWLTGYKVSDIKNGEYGTHHTYQHYYPVLSLDESDQHTYKRSMLFGKSSFASSFCDPKMLFRAGTIDSEYDEPGHYLQGIYTTQHEFSSLADELLQLKHTLVTASLIEKADAAKYSPAFDTVLKTVGDAKNNQLLKNLDDIKFENAKMEMDLNFRTPRKFTRPPPQEEFQSPVEY